MANETNLVWIDDVSPKEFKKLTDFRHKKRFQII